MLHVGWFGGRIATDDSDDQKVGLVGPCGHSAGKAIGKTAAVCYDGAARSRGG
jgi:hypothetical protein